MFEILILGHCAFGVETDMQNDIDNIYMQKSMACFAVDIEKLFLVKLSNVMPFLTPVLNGMSKISMNVIEKMRELWPSLLKNAGELPSTWIIRQVENVVKERLSSGKRKMDLLQLMLDAAVAEEFKVI